MLDFDSWVQRMKTPEDQIKTLKYLQENASDVVKNILIFKRREF